MSHLISRRDIVKSGAAAASLAAIGNWNDLLGAPVQGQEVVPWTDVPANFNPSGALDSRLLDRSRFITANQDFYLVQHYGTPTVDPAAYRLKLSGLFGKPMELTLDELKRRPRFEQVVGFECGGNSNNSLNRLAGNAKWTGTRVRDLLRDAGLDKAAREVVFFGADKGCSPWSTGAAARTRSSSISAAASRPKTRCVPKSWSRGR